MPGATAGSFTRGANKGHPGRVRETPIYYYSSASGLVRRFAQRLGRDVRDLGEREVRTSEVDGAWVLLTPSYKSGNARNDTVPQPVKRFLRSANNRRHLVGLIGSGNRNFGEFCLKKKSV